MLRKMGLQVFRKKKTHFHYVTNCCWFLKLGGYMQHPFRDPSLLDFSNWFGPSDEGLIPQPTAANPDMVLSGNRWRILMERPEKMLNFYLKLRPKGPLHLESWWGHRESTFWRWRETKSREVTPHGHHSSSWIQSSLNPDPLLVT